MARRSRPGKPGPFLRLVYRTPAILYALGAGPLLGHRFLMVVHRGRKSGRLYRTVLEVVSFDPVTQESIVAAVYGSRADWYRNLQAARAVEVQTGRARFVPAQRVLSEDEAASVFAGYERRHPRLARLIPRLFGIAYDGSPAARRALANRIPMMAFRAPAPQSTIKRASLESLAERLDLGLEILHPGDRAITKELAEQCGVGRDTRLLDVASGTGESALLLEETLGAAIVGVEASSYMVARARRKAEERRLKAQFLQADAHALPFADGSFDVAVCECTMCLLDKTVALQETARVVRSRGWIGIHDLCWREGAPAGLRDALARMEGEHPETLEGWRELFQRAGLREIITLDRSAVIPPWMTSIRRQVGWSRLLAIAVAVVKWWGIGGLWRVIRSERIFRSRYLGYGIVVGRKPH